MSKNPKAKSQSQKKAKTASESETPLADEVLESIHAESDTEADTEAQEREKFKFEFYGSDVLRMQAPQVMDIADTIADEWLHDGEFNDIPLGSPVAQALVGQGLRKAKEVEKKLDEKGVFLMARMGVDYLKSKIKK